MATERKVKCKICGKQDYKANMVQVGKRYSCKECYEETGGESDWDLLFETIKRIYGKEPNGIMYRQLKEFRDSPYNYTDSGMNATLKYVYDILDIPLKEDVRGIGIIPYYYDECKQYYMAIQRSEASLEGAKEVDDIVITSLDFSARESLIRSNRKPLGFDETEEDELEE